MLICPGDIVVPHDNHNVPSSSVVRLNRSEWYVVTFMSVPEPAGACFIVAIEDDDDGRARTALVIDSRSLCWTYLRTRDEIAITSTRTHPENEGR